jgi:hypothetical protein
VVTGSSAAAAAPVRSSSSVKPIGRTGRSVLTIVSGTIVCRAQQAKS